MEKLEQRKQLTVTVVEKFSPQEFYTKTPEVVEEIKKRIEAVGSVVFEISEDGKKQLKNFQASENKVIKIADDIRKTEYSRLTADIKINHDLIFTEIKNWAASLKKQSSYFEEFEKKQLNEIKIKTQDELCNIQESTPSLREEFKSKYDIESLVKMSALTATGSLTKSVKDEIKKLIDADIAKQNLHDQRVDKIKIKCYESDITTPFSKEYVGAEFYAEEPVFLAKLNCLIAFEVERVAQSEAKIKKQLEEKHQAEIDKKVADQIKADKKLEELHAQNARDLNAQVMPESEKLVVSEPPPVTPEYLMEKANRISNMAEHTDNRGEYSKLSAEANALVRQAQELKKRHEEQKPAHTDKRAVLIICYFESSDVKNKLDQKLIKGCFYAEIVVKFRFNFSFYVTHAQIVEKIKPMLPRDLTLINIEAKDA